MNYNDGNWHGHNGGKCPVHPETVVECLWSDGSGFGNSHKSSEISWDKITPVSFRVIKEHKEPREFWVCYGNSFRSIDEAKKYYGFSGEIIHVREVLE